MATIKFFTKTKRKASELATLYCRVRHGKLVDQTEKSGILLSPDHFNNTTGNIRFKADFKDKDQVNDKLDSLKDHLKTEIKQIADQSTLPKDWLKIAIDRFYNPDNYKPKVHNLFTFIQDFIDKAPLKTVPKTGRPVCYKQIREYERTFHYLKEFAKDKKRQLDFKDITLDFYHDFMVYLQSEKTVTRKNGKTIKEPGLALNTIGKKVQTLKIFLNAATDEGVNENRQYKSHRFTAVKEESESIYLTEQEIESIYKLDLSNDKSLERVRDLFIIGCWTGLRYSDWNQVQSKDIIDGFLELKQSKTGGAVVIPIHSTVEAIIDKYNGDLPPVISNQKFNQALKKIAEQSEINEKVHKGITKGGQRISKSYYKHELVSTHTARRSFATNLYKAGISTLMIMAITGHKTETAFLKYIKVTNREHAEKLQSIWRSQVKLKAI